MNQLLQPSPVSANHRAGAGLFLILGLLVGAGSIARSDDAKPTPPQYHGDIERLLEAHCISCHQPGQVGPMSLQTYGEVRPWAKAIRMAVNNREMPPFHAAGPIGRYLDDPRLEDAEIQRIVDWVDRGCPPGQPASPSAGDSGATSPDPSSKADPEPDFILETQPYHVEADKEIYALHFLDYEFQEDTWIRGFEFFFSDLRAVHHSSVYVFKPKRHVELQVKAGRLDHLTGVGAAYSNVGAGLIGWLPGQSGLRLAPGGMMMIPAGTKIALQNHYAPLEEAVDLVCGVGVHLYNGVIDVVRGTQVIEPQDILIPPGEPDYRLNWTGTFQHDVDIDTFAVHAHLRGKSFSITLQYPDGAEKRIFEIPRYDFHWQRVYELAQPIRAPKGTRAIHEMVWDNSAANPDNPDPTKTVKSGFGSEDEMWISGIGFTVADINPDPMYIRDGVEVPVNDRGLHRLEGRQQRLLL